MNEQASIRVLFVCLGNICRSPTAHGVFRARVDAAGLAERIEIDSAGTGDWHIGKPPDARAAASAANRGVDIDDLRARQVRVEDFDTFDYVLAMDGENLADLQGLSGRASERRARIALLSEFSDRYRGKSVPDPYFGGDDGFERVLDMIEDSTDGLLAEITARLD
ncbi:low molecular weight protein-tyrosine-phosphatase [Salinisphaera sp. T31B1]|uniref:low molecular weight protein-tyrosine-phosphatase n=1 Tax=Salinisphaera sp. T31B1 TaxID=727963 RepID=UPI00333FF028